MKIIRYRIPLLVLILSLSAVSCKKESKVDDISSMQKDSAIADVQSPAAPEISVMLNEKSPQQMADFLSAKKNDTVYVTNFFATWCGPCVKEIPHFKEKMASLAGKPVKFTFVSLDEKTDWLENVKEFTDEQGITGQSVLLNGSVLGPDFFKSNFKTWDGSSIPFTVIKKGEQVMETVGMMSKEELDSKINQLLSK